MLKLKKEVQQFTKNRKESPQKQTNNAAEVPFATLFSTLAGKAII